MSTCGTCEDAAAAGEAQMGSEASNSILNADVSEARNDEGSDQQDQKASRDAIQLVGHWSMLLKTVKLIEGSKALPLNLYRARR